MNSLMLKPVINYACEKKLHCDVSHRLARLSTELLLGGVLRTSWAELPCHFVLNILNLCPRNFFGTALHLIWDLAKLNAVKRFIHGS